MSQTVLIIGAGAGLSKSIAKRFAQAGKSVVLVSRSGQGMDEIASETNALQIKCDATDVGEVTALFDRLDREGMSPETLVYNVGAYVRGPIDELDPADIRRTIDANAFGAFLAARECAARMKQAGRGTMLFTGASAGVKGYANSAAFAMGKFALRGLCQSLARELAPQNIHVVHFVIDGLILAPERGEAYGDPLKCLNPQQIAETYFQMAQQERSAWTWELELRPWTESF